MGIGFPLLQGLSSEEVKAILAHQFGHYSSGGRPARESPRRAQPSAAPSPEQQVAALARVTFGAQNVTGLKIWERSNVTVGCAASTHSRIPAAEHQLPGRKTMNRVEGISSSSLVGKRVGREAREPCGTRLCDGTAWSEVGESVTAPECDRNLRKQAARLGLPHTGG